MTPEELVDQSLTVFSRIKAKDIGTGTDRYCIRHASPAMYSEKVSRTSDADGVVHLTTTGVAQVPHSTMRFMEYGDFIAAGRPDDAYTVSLHDYIMLGEPTIAGEVTKAEALAELQGRAHFEVHAARDLPGFAGRGLLKYASTAHFEGS